MSYYIAVRNPKSEKFELVYVPTDGGSNPTKYSNEGTVVMDCKNMIKRYGEENVMLLQDDFSEIDKEKLK